MGVLDVMITDPSSAVGAKNYVLISKCQTGLEVRIEAGGGGVRVKLDFEKVSSQWVRLHARVHVHWTYFVGKTLVHS